ncbi:MAG: glycosyltransferase [Desulfotomaculum sp.]|nr:glycosyltransferase [Desulfotomaculum sp.]
MQKINKNIFVNSFILLIVMFIGYILTIYLDFFRSAIIGYSFLLIVLILTNISLSNNQLVRIFILLTATFITLRYWLFRTFFTLGHTDLLDSIAMLLLYAAETYSAVFIYIFGMFVNIWPVNRKSPSIPNDDSLLPVVDVFIPTYNESADIVNITACACTELDYPKSKLNIYILDDGATMQKQNDPDPKKATMAIKRYNKIKNVAEILKINYLTREKNEHAKAGNLNNALEHTFLDPKNRHKHSGALFNFGNESKAGELILALDCDHVPTKDFLKNTVGFFLEDEKLFLIQTPHFFINPSPVEKNMEISSNIPGEAEMFYKAIHPGLDFWNASFFCGSAALLNRKHLNEVGGISGNTITEDAETALALHAKGYRSIYLNKPMICGLSPETFEDFIIQRSRWTQGMLQILLLKNPLLLKGLTWYQKICYTNNCIFWFFGIVRVIFIFAPLAYLFFGLKIYNASGTQILSYALPHLLGSLLVTNYLYGKTRQPFFSEIFETIQSIFLIVPIIGVLLNPRAPKFKVTPKGKSLNKDFVSSMTWPFYIMLFFTLIGIPLGIFRWLEYPLERETIIICMVWVFFNLFLIFSCLGALYELKQVRKHHRITTKDSAIVTILRNKKSIKSTITDISFGGVNIILHEALAISLDENIIVSVTGTYNNNYNLKAIVKQHTKDANLTRIGCMFDISNIHDFKNIVQFVYGDSTRWGKLRENKQDKNNIITSFIYLLGHGIKGTVRNMLGVSLLIKEELITIYKIFTTQIPKTPLRSKNKKPFS